MSMPYPIHVALIGSSETVVSELSKYFRLSVPGIGGAYFCALNGGKGKIVISPADIPKGLITLWLALDEKAFKLCQEFHHRDCKNENYCRGFYNDIFPDACVLLRQDLTEKELHKELATWKKRIEVAYLQTS